MHSYLLPQLSRSYKHVLFRLLSRRCISTFRDRAMQHTLTPAIYLTVQTDRVKLYLEHRSAWNILFTDEHEHLNILIIFLSAHCSGDRAGVSRSLLGSAFSSPLHIHPWEAPRMIMNKMIKSYDKQREQYNEIIIGVWHCPLPLSR